MTTTNAQLEKDMRNFVRQWAHLQKRQHLGRGITTMVTHGMRCMIYGLQWQNRKIRAVTFKLVGGRVTEEVNMKGQWRIIDSPNWQSEVYADLAGLAEKQLAEIFA